MQLLEKLRKIPGFEVLIAIIYLRISTDREEQFSLTEQLMVTTEFCDKWGIGVYAVIEDRGESGGTFEKRKMATVFNHVRQGDANIVLTADRSRFGRGGITLNQAWEKQLNEVGGYLIAAKNPTDITTSEGRTQRDTDDFVAHIQRNHIGDHWIRTHARRRKEGKPHTGAPRMGYMICPECTLTEETLSNGKIRRRVTKQCGECNGLHQIDKFRADALAEFMERWTDGNEPARRLVIEMRKRGVTSVRNNPMTEAQWFAALDTGFGAGWLRRRTIPATGRGLTRKYTSNRPDTYDVWELGKHKPCITKPGLWERYKAKRGTPAEEAAFSSKVKHPFSPFLRCGRPKDPERVPVTTPGELCRSRMTAGKSRTGPKGAKTYVGTYGCRAVREKLCSGITISRHLADKCVLDWLSEQASDEEKGREAVAKAAVKKAEVEKKKSALQELETKIAVLERKLSRLTDLQLDEEAALHPTAFRIKQAEITAELDPLTAMRDQMKKKASARVSKPPSPAEFRSLADTWPLMNDDEKRMCLEPLVDHMLVVKQPGKKNNRLVIVPHWEVPAEEESSQDDHLAACG
ncbi:recombinase family protein [Actinacidiphila sp. ITFR-21]|uniref:recombinase family protein n=1 Tax=Actinacidiphila sp. ITFR-21 TaxID=3075199 RepID=UPI00288C0D88|nr:recombinase family protein [Streptomyces sp. ITFR-21]WNI17556.1 recombinase family protein [Streptomyces sp. ITFR-21]WNI17696.1 recombinase family protein [Streptomyces sp. ITFR-21]